MRRWSPLVGVWGCALWLAWRAVFATVPDSGDMAVIETVHARDRVDQGVDLVFQLSGGLRRPTHFHLDRPPRIVVDFEATRSGLQGATRAIRLEPVSFLEVIQTDRRTRAILHLTEPAHAELRAGPHQVIVALRHVENAPADAAPNMEKRQEKTASPSGGERLTMNFQDISTRAALQVIADFTGLNIVVNDNVTGSLTLRLKDVPWEQALEVILRSQGLAMRRDGDVILVGLPEELAAWERAQRQSQSEHDQIQPLQSRVFKLKYAQVEHVLAMIGGQGGNAGGTETEDEGGVAFPLSPRGSVLSDARTNTLIVHDALERLDALRDILAQIDRPVRQVMIESRIVNVDDNAFMNLGARFGFAQRPFVSGNTPGVINLNRPTGLLTNNNENLITALPAASIGGVDPASIFFLLGSEGRTLLQLELSALEQDGLAETVSTPRVITAGGHEASISQGFLIPFQENSSSGATATSFKEAMLSLTVTPRITPNDEIILDLAISDDSPVGGSSSIAKRSVSTQVRVKNSETVVLGGVMKTSRSNTKSKVPLLGDLPILGPLFRKTADSEAKSELLVFVTPTLMPEAGNGAEASK